MYPTGRQQMTADTTTVRIPREVQRALKPIAAGNRRTINAEATHALAKYVEANRHIVDAGKAAA